MSGNLNRLTRDDRGGGHLLDNNDGMTRTNSTLSVASTASTLDELYRQNIEGDDETSLGETLDCNREDNFSSKLASLNAQFTNDLEKSSSGSNLIKSNTTSLSESDYKLLIVDSRSRTTGSKNIGSENYNNAKKRRFYGLKENEDTSNKSAAKRRIMRKDRRQTLELLTSDDETNCYADNRPSSYIESPLRKTKQERDRNLTSSFEKLYDPDVELEIFDVDKPATSKSAQDLYRKRPFDQFNKQANIEKVAPLVTTDQRLENTTPISKIDQKSIPPITVSVTTDTSSVSSSTPVSTPLHSPSIVNTGKSPIMKSFTSSTASPVPVDNRTLPLNLTENKPHSSISVSQHSVKIKSPKANATKKSVRQLLQEHQKPTSASSRSTTPTPSNRPITPTSRQTHTPVNVVPPLITSFDKPQSHTASLSSVAPVVKLDTVKSNDKINDDLEKTDMFEILPKKYPAFKQNKLVDETTDGSFFEAEVPPTTVLESLRSKNTSRPGAWNKDLSNPSLAYNDDNFQSSSPIPVNRSYHRAMSHPPELEKPRIARKLPTPNVSPNDSEGLTNKTTTVEDNDSKAAAGELPASVKLRRRILPTLPDNEDLEVDSFLKPAVNAFTSDKPLQSQRAASWNLQTAISPPVQKPCSTPDTQVRPGSVSRQIRDLFKFSRDLTSPALKPARTSSPSKTPKLGDSTQFAQNQLKLKYAPKRTTGSNVQEETTTADNTNANLIAKRLHPTHNTTVTPPAIPERKRRTPAQDSVSFTHSLGEAEEGIVNKASHSPNTTVSSNIVNVGNSKVHAHMAAKEETEKHSPVVQLLSSNFPVTAHTSLDTTSTTDHYISRPTGRPTSLVKELSNSLPVPKMGVSSVTANKSTSPHGSTLPPSIGNRDLYPDSNDVFSDQFRYHPEQSAINYRDQHLPKESPDIEISTVAPLSRQQELQAPALPLRNKTHQNSAHIHETADIRTPMFAQSNKLRQPPILHTDNVPQVDFNSNAVIRKPNAQWLRDTTTPQRAQVLQSSPLQLLSNSKQREPTFHSDEHLYKHLHPDEVKDKNKLIFANKLNSSDVVFSSPPVVRKSGKSENSPPPLPARTRRCASSVNVSKSPLNRQLTIPQPSDGVHTKEEYLKLQRQRALYRPEHDRVLDLSSIAQEGASSNNNNNGPLMARQDQSQPTTSSLQPRTFSNASYNSNVSFTSSNQNSATACKHLPKSRGSNLSTKYFPNSQSNQQTHAKQFNNWPQVNRQTSVNNSRRVPEVKCKSTNYTDKLVNRNLNLPHFALPSRPSVVYDVPFQPLRDHDYRLADAIKTNYQPSKNYSLNQPVPVREDNSKEDEVLIEQATLFFSNYQTHYPQPALPPRNYISSHEKEKLRAQSLSSASSVDVQSQNKRSDLQIGILRNNSPSPRLPVKELRHSTPTLALSVQEDYEKSTNQKKIKLPPNAVRVMPKQGMDDAKLRLSRRNVGNGDAVTEIENMCLDMKLNDEDLLDGADRHDVPFKVQVRLDQLSKEDDDDDVFSRPLSVDPPEKFQNSLKGKPYFVQKRNAFADKETDDAAVRFQNDAKRKYTAKKSEEPLSSSVLHSPISPNSRSKQESSRMSPPTGSSLRGHNYLMNEYNHEPNFFPNYEPDLTTDDAAFRRNRSDYKEDLSHPYNPKNYMGRPPSDSYLKSQERAFDNGESPSSLGYFTSGEQESGSEVLL